MAVDLGFHHRFERGAGSRTLVLLHGTGGDEHDLIPLGRALAPDASLLSPRGKVLENGMPRFFRRLAMGVFDVEDLKERASELGRFIADAAEHYGLERDQMTLVGYSNGANIAAGLLLLGTPVCRSAALLHAMVPFVPDVPPDLDSTAVLITAGRRDPMIPLVQTQELADLLSRLGADVRLEIQPGGHELAPPEVTATKQWLARIDAGARQRHE